LTDVIPLYLLNSLDEATAIKVWESLSGMRVYFSKGILKQYNIQKDFKNMKENSKAKRIRALAYRYEMCESSIRKILRKDLKLFDV